MSTLPTITSIYFDPTTDFGFKKLFGTIPNILNEPIFMKAFDVAKVSNLDPNDYILYQISKSKKYDMELVEESAEKRGIEIGEINKTIKVILTLNRKGYIPSQISEMLDMTIQEVEEIIKKHGKIKVK